MKSIYIKLPIDLLGEQVRLAIGRWPDGWQDEMGGRTGRSGGMWWLDGKGRGGEGRARRGGGGGGGRRVWEVARRGGDARREGLPDEGGGGCPTGWEGVPDGDLWGPDGMGGCPNGKDAGDGKGGV
jgi:hypothetical protein